MNSDNCNLATCRYNQGEQCTNEKKRKECVEVATSVLCVEDLGERRLVSNRLYRHFKGKLYYVMDVAENTETGKKMVVYQAMYPPYKHYVRDYDEFMSEVDREKYPEAKQKYRFELVETQKE